MKDRLKFRVFNKLWDCYSMDDFYIDEDGDLNILGSEYIVEQCTGLKDKNGNLIYENDIVIKSDFNAAGYLRTRTCRVFWHEKWLEWAIETEYGDVYSLSEFEQGQYEIVGNINENKELLDER